MEQQSRETTRPVNRYSVLNVDRKLTNKIVGIIFAISFVLWLIATIYGVAVPIENSPKINFDGLNTARIFIAIGFVLLNAVFTLIIFIALRWIPHVTSVILWTFWVPVPIFIASAIQQTTFWNVSAAIGSILSCFLILILLKSEWFHLSEAVLKEACKMVMSVPSTYVFALFTYLLSAFAIGITMAAIIRLVLASTSIFTMLLIIINYFFGFWTLIVIVALSWMTVSGTYAEYHLTENKDSVSFHTVLKIFGVNCRYHIGTAAMFYPLLGGLRALYYVAVLVLFLIMEYGFNKTIICFTVYNIFDPILLRIIFMGSATTCGIKGEDFYSSMAHTMTVFTDRRFILVIKVMELLFGISSALAAMMTSFAVFGYIGGSLNESTSWQTIFLYIVLVGVLVFIATLLSCLTAACYTILFCLDENEMLGSPSSNLLSALNHDGPPNWFQNTCGGCIPDFEYDVESSD